MDLRRLRHGEWIAAAGGVVLVVSLFLDWYREFVGVDLAVGLTGFESFDVLDVVLVLIALLAAIAIAVGGWESIRDERVRGQPPGPEPELRPTPPPDA